MMRIPVRFAAEFDEISRVRSCQSSGSEHSADLSDLVNSFLEREIGEQRQNYEIEDDVDEKERKSREVESRVALENLFDCENDDVKRSIRSEVESAYLEVTGGDNCSSTSPDFKRRLMYRLRSRGVDAGLCKSIWEKSKHSPPGKYEYIDVNAGGSRYIVEVFLAGEFTIARPTERYAALLEVFPKIYVGKGSEMKQVVRLMCDAIKRSMACAGIHVAPWRRLVYMESKWFGSHRRTINEMAIGKASKMNGGDLLEKGKVGIVAMQGITARAHCRQEFGGVRIGNLAAILN